MSPQPQQAERPQPQTLEAVREGSRWLHAKPSPDSVRGYFEEQQLHEGMEHGPYVSGLVLISATEKVKETRVNPNGSHLIMERDQTVYTPYVKVDTRIAYFWDYVLNLNGGKLLGDFVGVIEPVEQVIDRDIQSPYFNANMPTGFSVYVVRNRNDSIVRYIVCTMRVAIYERAAYAQKIRGEQARPLLAGEDSKQTAAVKRDGWADDFAIMKARTGAVGRALGVAGILVIGTGVATAEDMQEQASGSAAGGSVDEDKPVTLPAVTGPAAQRVAQDSSAGVAEGTIPAEGEQQAPQPLTDEQLREQATTMRDELQRDHPDAWTAYVEWWNERGFGPLNELEGPALKGAVTKLARDLDAAKS